MIRRNNTNTKPMLLLPIRNKTTTKTTTIMAIGIIWCCMLLPRVCLAGWVVPKSSSTTTTPTPRHKPSIIFGTTTTTTTTKPPPLTSTDGSNNQLFYKSGGGCYCEQPMFQGVQSSTALATSEQQQQQQQQLVSEAATIPWLRQDEPEGDSSSNDNVNDNDPNNVFLSNWNWQLDYFQKHLTNLKVNNKHEHEQPQDIDIDNDNDDLYCLDDGTKRMYTVSLSSDEYRDIRLTYMDFPSCKTFRCLAYPSDPEIPILGMGLMKFGRHQHLAVLDYHPLSERESHHDLNDAYTSELLRMRAENPTMSQPHTYKHFVTEERKYFTKFPLLGKFNDKRPDSGTNDAGDDDDDEHDDEHEHEQLSMTSSWFRALQRGQRDFVATHVRLTQQQQDERKDERKDEYERDVLKVHSDFDTHVSKKEPAGPMLTATYGPELAHKLVHEVIFPLSRNTLPTEPEPPQHTEPQRRQQQQQQQQQQHQ